MVDRLFRFLSVFGRCVSSCGVLVQEEEEQRFDADQELLDLRTAAGSCPEEGGVQGGVAVAAQVYRNGIKALLHQQRLRAMVGEDWEARVDPLTGMTYYFNGDTSQSVWDMPLVLHVRKVPL
jgi:hypothetical protein